MSANVSNDLVVDEEGTDGLCPQMDYLVLQTRSDVVFRVGDKTLPALKDVLIMRSPYFRSLFSGDFNESQTNEVDIKYTTFEAFKAFLGFFYTSELPFDNTEEDTDIDLDLLLNVCILADRYQTPSLLIKVVKHFRGIVSYENLEFVSRVGFAYDLKTLTAAVKEFIHKNYRQLIVKDTDYLKRVDRLTGGYLLEKLLPNGHQIKVTKVVIGYERKKGRYQYPIYENVYYVPDHQDHLRLVYNVNH